MKATALWEYKTLQSDYALQGEQWEHPGGFKAWYTEVFLGDEAWAEIREATE